MGTAGRHLLLFFLAWAAFWDAPACSAAQESPTARAASPRQVGLPPSWAHREASETVTEPSLPDGLGQAAANARPATPPAFYRQTRAQAALWPTADILLL